MSKGDLNKLDMNFVFGAFGIIGTILTIISLWYAVYVTHKNKIEKLFTYEIISPIPIADVIKGKGLYSLKVVYERPDNEIVYIQHAFLQYIRFSNFGKLPITNADLVTLDPIRIEIIGHNVLDISLANTTRDVCDISLGQPVVNKDITSININFNFLDFQDGGLIQLLTDSRKIKVEVKGTIIGMPEGVNYINFEEKNNLPTWGCVLGVILEILGIVSIPVLYNFVMKSYQNIWILLLPFVSLFVPVFLFALLTSIITGRKIEFPKSLHTPLWFETRSEINRNRYDSIDYRHDIIEPREQRKK